ncbi:MAG: flagellar biosynthesis protein FlgB [Methylothermaceae bacteria B42]|nr:MAG: flagellar biosynthesis protein FlgB [Methylothermaceae bacteria B42]HHJ38592.1 flagellar basal body rod protein FlgB [Methylothermaceae bacterium]
MKISFDNALGFFPKSLELRAKRTELLASNLANADTPGYKARDFNIDRLLQEAKPQEIPLQTTRPGHLSLSKDGIEGKLLYRVPQQASLDGNTVEEHIEQAKFAENALRYQTTLRFINGRISSLMLALKGE